MQGKKQKNNLILKIISFTMVLALTFGFCLFTSPFKANNVNASSYPITIHTSEYSLGVGSIYYYDEQYDVEKPFQLVNMFGESFFSFKSQIAMNLGLWDYYDMYFTYSKVEDNYGDKVSTYDNIKLSTSHNSERYRFVSEGTIEGAYLGFVPNYYDNYIYNSLDFRSLRISNIEVNIPVKYATVTSVFDYAYYARYLFYLSNGIPKLNIVYSMDNGTFDSDPLMSVYFTFNLENDIASSFNGRFLYSKDILRIDRSEFVRYETIVQEVPVYQFTVLNAVKDGINSFLGVEVLPNFSIGNFLALALGISFFGFLLHLIIK